MKKNHPYRLVLIVLAALTLSFVSCNRDSSVGGFSEGLALVSIEDEGIGKYGYIDKTGKIIINPQFDDAESFSEGLAAVRIGDYRTGKYGYIDRTGKIVINPQFDYASYFLGGHAHVKIGDKWNDIDKAGKIVINHD